MSRSAGTEFVVVDGGSFRMGDDSHWSYPADGEAPVREVEVDGFEIATTAVTNAEFAMFVEATGHVCDAERFGWSFVFGGLLPDDFPPTRGVADAPWWRQVHGADWRHPEGPHSGLEARQDHPVVHVSLGDAAAHAAWAGGRIPTEAEWEKAAKAGTTTPFPWGHDLEPDGAHRCNVFQGRFPTDDTAADGWAGTCPVDAFPPNDLGLHNVVGNVWEWTVSAWDEATVIKGGSYLCHESYCRRYRPAARSASEPTSTAGNVGFRLAR